MFQMPSVQEALIKKVGEEAIKKLQAVDPNVIIHDLFGAYAADLAELHKDGDGNGKADYDECIADLDVAKAALQRCFARAKAAHDRVEAAAKK